MIHFPKKAISTIFKRAFIGGFLLLLSGIPAISQMTVYPVQDFSFGTFYQGSSGGSIDISPSGSRSASGDIVLMNTGISHSQAIFEIEAPGGTIVSVSTGPDAILSGSNGGTLTLKIGTFDPQFPLVTSVPPPGRTQVKVGGTLVVGNRTSSPAGNYTGSFSITFHQE